MNVYLKYLMCTWSIYCAPETFSVYLRYLICTFKITASIRVFQGDRRYAQNGTHRRYALNPGEPGPGGVGSFHMVAVSSQTEPCPSIYCLTPNLTHRFCQSPGKANVLKTLFFRPHCTLAIDAMDIRKSQFRKILTSPPWQHVAGAPICK